MSDQSTHPKPAGVKPPAPVSPSDQWVLDRIHRSNEMADRLKLQIAYRMQQERLTFWGRLKARITL